jgi:hypothetical protein
MFLIFSSNSYVCRTILWLGFGSSARGDFADYFRQINSREGVCLTNFDFVVWLYRTSSHQGVHIHRLHQFVILPYWFFVCRPFFRDHTYSSTEASVYISNTSVYSSFLVLNKCRYAWYLQSRDQLEKRSRDHFISNRKVSSSGNKPVWQNDRQ